MPELIIERVSQYTNKLFDINILLNDNDIGVIRDGEKKAFAIEPGHYRLMAKIDWCFSNEISFKINEGEKKTLMLTGASPFLAPLYAFFARNKYLKVTESN